MPSFDGLNVLVDGLYRFEAQGSGISTYSRTLGDGLSALGCNVSWLSGASMAGGRPDALADEVALADRPPQLSGLRERAQTIRRMGQGLTSASVTARPLTSTGAVFANQGAPSPNSVFLAPDIFVKAHYRHMLLRQFTDIRAAAKFDVLHLTAPLPVRMAGVKTVTTIHDLVPIRLPWTTPDNKSEFIDRVRTSAKLSDLIITVSEASKRDIVEILDMDPDRVAVTWQPSDLATLTDQEREDLPRVLSRFGLAEQGYALFVGAIEPKKNLRRLIEAFLETDSDMPLVIVGRKAWMWEDEIGFIEALSEAPRSRLRFMGYAERDDLRRLYAGAQMFLFPSLYEGFGLPPLEAMNAGCPVLASDRGSLPEVCGDGAGYADAMDRDDLRRKIEQMMGDQGLRARLSDAGRKRAQAFSKDAYVSSLASAYAKLLSF
jgi:glycosyltransferase involved in cell wall biosynthesis